MKIKNTLTTLSVAIFLSGCFGNNVDPLSQELNLPPPTESGFYENSATLVGQQFIEKVSDTVLFAYNSEDLTEKAKGILDIQAEFIKDKNIKRIVVEGHADERGTREYNLALGEKRGNTVKNYLVSKGVNPIFIQVISYGKERPLVESHNENAWSKNRRGVTIVM